MQIRLATERDASDLLQLHQAVAQIPGGIICTLDEITPDYISSILAKSKAHGLMLVAELEGTVKGEIHAYTLPQRAFRHALADLTIVVHPDAQRQGLGRQLFTQFLAAVEQDYYHILRVELFVRITNTSAIRFYESLGFVREGVHYDQIYNDAGELETPISMAWRNPGFRAGT